MNQEDQLKLSSYIGGFIACLALTLTSYFLVTAHAFGTWTITGIIGALALVQFIVQLIFFLHLRADTRPRWKLFVFGFMVLFTGIVVIGSIWIMHSLNYRMMPSPTQMNHYMNDQQGI